MGVREDLEDWWVLFLFARNLVLTSTSVHEKATSLCLALHSLPVPSHTPQTQTPPETPSSSYRDIFERVISFAHNKICSLRNDI